MSNKYSNILNVLLALALVILSVKITYLDSKTESDMDSKSKEEVILDNIMTRTSIRQYTDEKISEEQIEKLLKAGMAAPSAGNKQPWRFVVVQDKPTQQKITDNIGPAQPAAKAPLLIVVCADTTQTFPGVPTSGRLSTTEKLKRSEDGHDYWIEDCSAVSENILLAAHAMDLGAVWLGVYPQMQRCDFLRGLLSLPKEIMPLGMIAVGHPAESPKPKDKWNEDFIHQNTWTNNVADTKATFAYGTEVEAEWQKVSVEEAHLNPFTLFQNAAALNVGMKGAMNSMTIGWGQLGIIWGHDTHTCTVYVRQSRFTKHLMDENGTFTVEAFPKEYNNLLMNYLGKVSGRDEDKIKKSGLTLRHTDNGAPAFEEGNIIIECRKLSDVDIPMQKMSKDVTTKWYSRNDDKGNIHTQYIGEITAVWVKK